MLFKYLQESSHHLITVRFCLTKSTYNNTHIKLPLYSQEAFYKPRSYHTLSERQQANFTIIKSAQHQKYNSQLNSQKRYSGVKRRSIQVVRTVLDKKFNMEWPKITLFGDSITRRSIDPEHGCWGSLIAHRVGTYFDVNARGFEGYNSTWGLELMPQLFPKSYLDKVEIFIPFFGHNDGWQGSWPGAVNHEQFEKNTRAIIKYVLDNGLEKRKIIMMTPAWYEHELFTEYLKELKSPLFGKELEHAKGYAEVILRVAKENEIDVIDFFDITLKQDPLKEIFVDGVHLSQKGAHLLFDALMPVIEKKLEESFKKPLGDLWHAVPLDQHPSVEPLLKAYQEKLRLDAEEKSAGDKKN